MLSSVLTRKGQVSRHNCHPVRSQSWVRGGRSQLAAPQGQVPRPYPALITEGSRCPWLNWLLGSSGCPDSGGRLHPVRTASAIRWWEWQTGSPPLQGLGPTSGQLWWGLWIPAGHIPQFIPWAPRSPTDLRLDELEAPRRSPGSTSYLILPDDHHSADHWLNHPLMVTHRQLITWGRSPLWCWPMAKQDH